MPWEEELPRCSVLPGGGAALKSQLPRLQAEADRLILKRDPQQEADIPPLSSQPSYAPDFRPVREPSLEEVAGTVSLPSDS